MIKTEIKYKTGKIVFDDFSKVNLSNKKQLSNIEGVQVFNFKNSDGVLEKGMGIGTFTTYAENDLNSFHYPLNYQALNLEYFNKVMYFKQYFSNTDETLHRLLIHGSDGKLYLFQLFSNLNNANWVYELQFESIPAVLEYKKDGLDSILISANDKLVVWSTGRTPYELSDVPTITSMCVHNDVLYCTIAGETDKIWYTENLDPESVGVESEHTKYLILEGSAGGGRKAIVLKENVYIFCDYGIGRINTYAKSEPKYNEVYLTNSQIYPNTVVVCGDFAIFMTRDGLYKFTGSSVSKIDIISSNLLVGFNDSAVATSLKDYYYLALNVNFNDNNVVGCESEQDMKNNTLIKLNIHTNSYEIMRGIDIKDMLALKAGVEEKIILTFNSANKEKIGEVTDDGLCFDGVLEKRFSTNYIVQQDMDPITIRKFIIEASKDVVINIITENDINSFNTFKDGINEFQTIIPCKKFKVEIISNNVDAYVNSIEVEYVKQK